MHPHLHLRISRRWVLPAALASVVVVVVSAGAAAAIETDTVTSYWRGMWWSISLITTVGFIGDTPRTDAGAALSVVLMVIGFLLLAMVSASLASLFVRQEERPWDERELVASEAVLSSLRVIDARLAALEARLDEAGHPDRAAAPLQDLGTGAHAPGSGSDLEGPPR